jgi:hypothetical protein
VFGDALDAKGLNILLDKGELWARCGSLKREWNEQISRDKKKLEEDRKQEQKARRKAAAADREMLQRNINPWMARQAAINYP